jgi:hypothetical protein
MLAVVGFLTQENGIRLPGDIYYSGSAPTVSLSPPPGAGIAQIIVVMKSIDGTGNDFVCDFRNSALDFGWDSFDEETLKQTRHKGCFFCWPYFLSSLYDT